MITITEAEMTKVYDHNVSVTVDNVATHVERNIKEAPSKGVYRIKGWEGQSYQIAQKILTLFEEKGFSVDRIRYEILWGEPKRQFDEHNKRSNPPGDE